jgi:hypothetical protein
LFLTTGPGSLLSGLGRRQVGEPRICFRGHDLFIATGSGSLSSGLGRRQVGEPCICFRGHLCGYGPPRHRGLGGCCS